MPMAALDQLDLIDWRAAVLAGLSSAAGVAIAPASIMPTGAMQLAECQISAWEEANILDAYAETLGRIPFMLRNSFGSGSQFRVRDCVVKAENISTKPLREASAASKSTSEAVAEIRARLSLQIKELAEIVGVERPTVYAWIKGIAEPQKHNQSRLRRLQRIALAWARLSELPPGAAIRVVDDSGYSVIDLLKREPMPEEFVLERLRLISSKPTGEMRARRKSLRQFASEKGLDLQKVRMQTDEVDLTTGKRATME